MRPAHRPVQKLRHDCHDRHPSTIVIQTHSKSFMNENNSEFLVFTCDTTIALLHKSIAGIASYLMSTYSTRDMLSTHRKHPNIYFRDPNVFYNT